MQNLSLKTVAIGVATLGIIIFGVFYFVDSRGKKTPDTYINPAFSEYITSYTAGVVSSNSSIRIILASEAVDSSFIGKPASVKVFAFSPAIEGKSVWVDRRTIEFVPTARMRAGQIYEAEFLLSKLLTVSPELSAFEFSFQIMPQNFEVSINNVKPYINTELTRQRIEGVLQTADYADDKIVESMLQASQDGKMLKITWMHSGEGKQHSFNVEDVERNESPGSVTLSADGKNLGLTIETKHEVQVPALGDFKLINSKVVQNPNQYVVLQFSDPLKPRQDLRGLITIEEDRDLSFEFEVHDNEIWVYPPVRQSGTKTIHVEEGVRNINDYRMKTGSTAVVAFEQLKPLARFVGKGNILPSTDGLILPFEAVNLKAVDVTVLQIFENNMLQFLQVNDLQGNYDLNRVGRRLFKQKIQLDNKGITDIGKWNRYTLDLGKLIQAQPGAIYQISISFKKAYASYTCDGADINEEVADLSDELQSDLLYEDGYYEDEYYYDEDYDWSQRDNPCNSSYYTNSRTIRKNVLASDFGLLAKRGGDGTTVVVVNDLKTTEPISGVTIDFYNYQQQLLGSTTTSPEGKAELKSDETPFAFIARNGSQRGYMRMMDGESLSLSGFDVSGDYLNKGLKGFIYGERGVWRPGDSVYLSFILEDKNKTLPSAHPIVFEFQNPQGTIIDRQVKSGSENGFYRLATKTSPDDPTGNWLARIKVGGTEFNQQVKIETIKPNRLKINLDIGTDKLTTTELQGKLNVNWLHGAPGKNLKAEFDVTLSKAATSFTRYDDYVFEEPSRFYTAETQTIFQGSTDADGRATFNATLTSSERFPGFMTAVFRGKVFEESGNFSIDRFSVPYYPYTSYAGLKTPQGEKYSGMLFTDSTQRLDVVFLDANGSPVPRKNATVSMYRLDRYWWWDNAGDNVANYIEGNNAQLITSGDIDAPQGKGNWSFKIATADWGTYYIRVCDPVSGHCSGKTVYIDQPGYYGRNSREDKSGATQLTFSAEKTKYNVGEAINLTIPGSGQGRALVSIENGSRILSTRWIMTQKGDNQFSIPATADMSPNIFVNVSLLQPHSQTINDLPIRLYGVIPIAVEDPSTLLEPVITMPEEIQPGQEVIISVSERTKREMTFTLAMVDEGLLDITKFKTPDPWKRFYAREALGVRTWDLYDQVMGAFGSKIERLLAIGGDGELESTDEDPRANRFKPVVKFFGPVTIKGNEKREFRFIMPQYIGSVKTMVVAGFNGAYGHAEKTTPVRKPLMVLATLPRVLGPEEKVRLPITLFASDKKIGNVKVDVKTSGAVVLSGDISRQVVIPTSGDVTVDFELTVKSETGIGKITVVASAGAHQSSDEIEIEIRNPNPPITVIADGFVEPGKSWNGDVMPIGIAGTNSAVLEVSSIPPINLGSRLRYLMEYPHGCVEQTTSAAFPQLYLSVVKQLTDAEQARTKFNVTRAIERLKQFVTRDGGFAYWPGNDDSDSWGSTYAGHFLIEAAQNGYFVPADMLKRWKKYQRNKALEWRRNENKYHNTDLVQAYRLYALAAADAAELSAMNRLRESQDLSLQAKWMLAAAYVKAGQPEAGKKLVANLSTTVAPYQEMTYSYGSDVRDRAIILETLLLLNEKEKAFALVKEISSALSNSNYWMSTQSVAYSLKAIGMFVSIEKRGNLKYAYTLGGKTMNVSTDLPLAQVPLNINDDKKSPLKITNQSNGSLFVRLISTGTPTRGQEQSGQSNLILTTTYTDANGTTVNPAMLTQGTEFFANVTVKHPGVRGQYQNLALTQIFPSGWEINNLRLTNDENTVKADYGDYQDIRDDRVYTYFGLSPGSARTFRTILTASYSGTYYLPAVSCEAMYDNSIYAREKGQIVQVAKNRNP
jgi:alpha-2-macroglobulin